MTSVVLDPGDERLVRRYERTFLEFSLVHDTYAVPCDETEHKRAEIFDEILYQLFNRRIWFPDLVPQVDPIVLDCGCGKGAWIERLLEEHMGIVDITGIDLIFRSADSGSDDSNSSSGGSNVVEVQEYIKKHWNLNVSFRHDRSSEPLRPESFDLIHSRCLAEGIDVDRWPEYIQELKLLLKPGGWLQMAELEFPFQSDAGLLPDTSCLTQWWQLYAEMLQQMNKNARAGRDLEMFFRNKDFQSVHMHLFELPIGSWREAQAEIGAKALESLDQFLESHSLWPFRGIYGMSEERYHELLRGARAELRESRYKLYIQV